MGQTEDAALGSGRFFLFRTDGRTRKNRASPEKELRAKAKGKNQNQKGSPPDVND